MVTRETILCYQVQANAGSGNPRLRSMAAMGNGANRAPARPGLGGNATLGGSTLASVNVQQSAGYIPSRRVGSALHHSRRDGDSLYVVSGDSKPNPWYSHTE